MDKIKHSMCFSCCFRRNDVEPLAQEYQSLRHHNHHHHQYRNADSTWIGAKPAEIPQNMKEKCATFVSVACKSYRQRRRRRGNFVGNFKYDPLSYSLNFDEGLIDYDDCDGSNELYNRYRSFSSRLPTSPPAPTSATMMKNAPTAA